MKQYKIEEVSKLCGLTKRTIRYYEELGLLFPAERSEGGFRLYGDRHIERLRLIVDARDVLGISLQDMQEFVDIREQFNSQRQSILATEDERLRREKLDEIDGTIGRQLRIIDEKLGKLHAIRTDLLQLRERVLDAKSKPQQQYR